jgi:hypothetical protein
VTHAGREIGTDGAVAEGPHLAGQPRPTPCQDAEDAGHFIDHQKRPSRLGGLTVGSSVFGM